MPERSGLVPEYHWHMYLGNKIKVKSKVDTVKLRYNVFLGT